jgi:hypothetical protein
MSRFSMSPIARLDNPTCWIWPRPYLIPRARRQGAAALNETLGGILAVTEPSNPLSGAHARWATKGSGGNELVLGRVSPIATELVGLARSQMKMSAMHCSGLDFRGSTAYGNGYRRGRRRWSKQ